MNAILYPANGIPRLVPVTRNDAAAVALALSLAPSTKLAVVDTGSEPAGFTIYHPTDDISGGVHNPVAEKEAERLTGEWCDFSGMSCFVYEDERLFPQGQLMAANSSTF